MKRLNIKSLLAQLLLFCSMTVLAQNPELCGSYTIDTAALRAARDFEIRHLTNRTEGSATVIRVYFHILAYTDGTNPSATLSQMQSELATLVSSYTADNICFINAGVNIINNTQLDTNFNANTNSPTLWDPYRVPNCINIFYPQKIKGNNAACPGGCGIGGTSLAIPNTFCLISQGNIGAGQTISHEVGHCMGLIHTFEPVNGKEDINGSNSSTTADLITDTPADPYGYGTSCYSVSASGCVYTGTCADPNGQTNFSPPYTNLMAYWWAGRTPACYSSLALTAGQYTRVDSYLGSNASLITTTSPTTVTLGPTTISSGYLMTSAVTTLTTSGTISITATANATLGGQTILLEPGFFSSPTSGGLTLIRTKTCN